MDRRLILHAGGDTTSAAEEILEHFQGARRAVIIPYAVKDHDRVTNRFNERFAGRGPVSYTHLTLPTKA